MPRLPKKVIRAQWWFLIKKADEVFKWNSGEGYITDVDISKDGKYIAVAQMMSDGDETYSKIRVMNTSNGQESGTAICEDTLIAKN